MKKEIANWGNYPIVESDEKTFIHLSEAKKYIDSVPQYIPRGNGRCYGDASLGLHTINTTKFQNILHFDEAEGIFECESGLTLDQILPVIIPKGWFLPVTPGTKFITIGGAVASDVHGKNHHVDGCFSHHVISMDVLVGTGEIITCSPTNHTDLFHATCGGMGLTGLIIKVKFKLKKIETSYIKQKQIKARNLEEVLNLFDQYSHYTYSVAWIDCLKKGKNFGRSILMLGEHATKKELEENKKVDAVLKVPSGKQINFPFYLPGWVLNTFTVKAFNALYYGKNLKKEINNYVLYEPFFYPLDAILNWNRGYGKNGFIQYQFVVPLHAKAGLIEILEKISEKGLGSFLAVLKVFGKQDSLISFPFEGYTLALDIPVKNNLFPILDELDQIVLKHEGRLYMSKDARMHQSILEKGYPKLQEFKSIIKKYGGNKVNSIQSDRLNLTNS